MTLLLVPVSLDRARTSNRDACDENVHIEMGENCAERDTTICNSCVEKEKTFKGVVMILGLASVLSHPPPPFYHLIAITWLLSTFLGNKNGRTMCSGEQPQSHFVYSLGMSAPRMVLKGCEKGHSLQETCCKGNPG